LRADARRGVASHVHRNRPGSILYAAPSSARPLGASEAELLAERQKQLRASFLTLGKHIEQLEVKKTLAPPPTTSEEDDALANVERLCERFHSVARQIRARHDAPPAWTSSSSANAS
jgi:hypothetical protein